MSTDPAPRQHTVSISDVAILSYQQDVVSPADDSGIELVETTLEERFSGGLDGDASARHLRVIRPDGTATFTCVERFAGTLGGRSGSFALTAAGHTDEASVVHGRWEVVAGSGTGELTGLRGFATFHAAPAPGTMTGWAATDVLAYWFER